MKEFKKIEDAQILSVKIESSLSELLIVVEDDEDNEKIIECREVIYCEYSRSHADGGPGFYVFKTIYNDNFDQIISYLDDRYGFQGKNKSPKLDNKLKLKWLKIEGDVCINIVCEDLRIYS